MQTVTIGFSKPKGKKFPIFSWIIRLVDWTPYSHVYLRWDSKYLERTLVYEASGTTVHFVEGSRFDKRIEVVHQYPIEVTDAQKKKMVQKAVDFSNAPYGIKQVAGIGIVKLARLFGKDIKNPFSDGSATWVCSEIVNDVLKDLGMDVGVHRDNVTPKDIQKFLEARVNVLS